MCHDQHIGLSGRTLVQSMDAGHLAIGLGSDAGICGVLSRCNLAWKGHMFVVGSSM